MDDPDFKSGKFDITYVPEHPHLLDYEEEGDTEDFMALVAAAIAAYHR
jgi:pyruvate carboxylase subunit A